MDILYVDEAPIYILYIIGFIQLQVEIFVIMQVWQ